MKPIIAKAQESQLRKDHPVFRPGDTIRVNVRLREGEAEKERIQAFEGVVMSRRGELLGESFTVRRVSFGIGVERIFPVHSPMISSIEVVRQGRVRRAKLNYLRARKGKAARIKQAEKFEPVAAGAGAGLCCCHVLNFCACCCSCCGLRSCTGGAGRTSGCDCTGAA